MKVDNLSILTLFASTFLECFGDYFSGIENTPLRGLKTHGRYKEGDDLLTIDVETIPWRVERDLHNEIALPPYTLNIYICYTRREKTSQRFLSFDIIHLKQVLRTLYLVKDTCLSIIDEDSPLSSMFRDKEVYNIVKAVGAEIHES